MPVSKVAESIAAVVLAEGRVRRVDIANDAAFSVFLISLWRGRIYSHSVEKKRSFSIALSTTRLASVRRRHGLLAGARRPLSPRQRVVNMPHRRRRSDVDDIQRIVPRQRLVEPCLPLMLCASPNLAAPSSDDPHDERDRRLVAPAAPTKSCAIVPVP